MGTSRAAGKRNEKEPGIAIGLSLVIPGAGHLYLGETPRALMYGVPAIAGAVIALGPHHEDDVKQLAAFVWLGSWALSLFDIPYAIRRHLPPGPQPVVTLGVAPRVLALRVKVPTP